MRGWGWNENNRFCFVFFSQKALVPKQPPCTGPFVVGMNAVLCSWRSTLLVSAATWSKHLFMKGHRLACALFTLDTPCWSYTLQWLGVVVEELCHGPRQLVFPLHVFSLACFVSAHTRDSQREVGWCARRGCRGSGSDGGAGSTAANPPKGSGRQVKMHPSENPTSRDHTSSRAAYVSVNQEIFTTGTCYWNSVFGQVGTVLFVENSSRGVANAETLACMHACIYLRIFSKKTPRPIPQTIEAMLKEATTQAEAGKVRGKQTNHNETCWLLPK